MKLLRLKLGVPFRSLAAGFEVTFLREWNYDTSFQFHPYCLAGRNGSGKSNLLEALAAIFFHLEAMNLSYRPDSFRFDEQTNPKGFRAEVCTPDAFELEYFMPLAWEDIDAPLDGLIYVTEDEPEHVLISITKEINKRPKTKCVNLQSLNDADGFLNNHKIKLFLPKYVIGYSSGHNEILSLPFFKMRFINYDEYVERLSKGDNYDGKPEGRLLYLDDQYSQAILLCHFLFPSKAVTKVFEDKIGLKGIRQFRLIIRRHHLLKLHSEKLQTMSEVDRNDPAKKQVELTSLLASRYDGAGQLKPGLIEKLIKCSTTHHEEDAADGKGHDLVLDYWVNEETQLAFQTLFGVGTGGSREQNMAASALNLFQSLQTLLTLNYYQVLDDTKAELYQSGSLYLNETIPIPASHERIFRFKEFEIIKDGVTDRLYGKSLSDGEHQLIHTIGLCLLFRHENALFLLDEPETHLNPEWRASYVSTLRAALEADAATKEVMREVLLTSHSPFIISDCQQEKVLVFEKNDQGKVEWHNPDFQTFGASANAITIKVFKRKETIGNYALSKLQGLRDRLDDGTSSPDTLIDEAARELGDSVEKVLFINKAMDKKEGI